MKRNEESNQILLGLEGLILCEIGRINLLKFAFETRKFLASPVSDTHAEIDTVHIRVDNHLDRGFRFGRNYHALREFVFYR